MRSCWYKIVRCQRTQETLAVLRESIKQNKHNQSRAKKLILVNSKKSKFPGIKTTVFPLEEKWAKTSCWVYFLLSGKVPGTLFGWFGVKSQPGRKFCQKEAENKKDQKKIPRKFFFRSLKTNFQFRFFLFFCQFFALLSESLVGWHFASKRPKPSKLKIGLAKIRITLSRLLIAILVPKLFLTDNQPTTFHK